MPFQKKVVQPDWAIKASQELGRYYLAVNPTYNYVHYQQEYMIPPLEQLARGDFDRLMIFIPAGHAKSDIATIAFPTWYLGQPGTARKNVIIVANGADLANKFGTKVRDIIQKQPKYRVIFPHVQIDNATRAKDYFKTSLHQEFMAFGVDGGITGNRADLIVMEDWIKNPAEATSEIVQHHLYEDIYKAVIRDRLRPRGKLLFIMTRWGVRDVAARILADEGDRWKVLHIPAQEHIEGCLDDDDCQCPYLWQDHYGRAKYDEQKKDRFLWASKWQQMPVAPLKDGFKEEWLRFYLPPHLKPEFRQDPKGGPPVAVAIPTDPAKLFRLNTYILVDPAMGKEAAHDRTAILIVAAGPENRVFLVDAVLDRLDPGERIAELIRLVRQWKPKFIAYEEYALTVDTYFLDLALKDQGLTDTAVISVGRAAQHYSGGRMKKHDRIMQLSADFRDGRIWLPKRMINRLADGTEFDVISYFINNEYLPYAGEGTVEHDDMLDCLSRIRDPQVVMEHGERFDVDAADETWGETSGGSWESRY